MKKTCYNINVQNNNGGNMSIPKLREAFNYTDIEDQISSLGYQNPQIDKGDSRQREAWKHLKDL